MEILKLVLIASTVTVAGCQRNANSNDALTNDLSINNSVGDENIANLTNAGAANVDAAFVTEAIKGDNGEVAIGNLAAAQAGSQASKDFGRMLATDHGAHKEKLAALATTAGMPVTDDPADEAKNNIDKLKTLRGAEFDKTFKRMMVEDHTKDIAKYEKQASQGDRDTAALAKETLPTLRKHLATANSL